MHKIELIGKQINVWTGGKSKLNYLGVCHYLKVGRCSSLYPHHVKLPVIIRGECKGRLSTVVRIYLQTFTLLNKILIFQIFVTRPPRQSERGGEIAKMLSMNIFHYLTLCNVESGNILHDKLSKRSLILGPTLCHFSTFIEVLLSS